MFDFVTMPEAVDAIPSHCWIRAEDFHERQIAPDRAELRAALKRAESRVLRLRAMLGSAS